MKKYNHLSSRERDLIYIYLQQGFKQKEIAEVLGRDPGTISRELSNNSSVIYTHLNNHPNKEKYKHYLPNKAQGKYKKRRRESKTPFPLRTPDLYKYVIQELRSSNSPNVIASCAKKKGIGIISHECIYQFVYSKLGRELELYSFLTRKHRKRKKWKGRKEKRRLIPNRIDISKRPSVVDSRRTYGHWEGDTIFGHGKKSTLVTILERKSRYVMIKKIPRKTANNTSKAIIESMKDLPKSLAQTLTLDNGCEFTAHDKIATKTDMKIFFATPYHSWERGANENVNGIIRRYLPKGTNFDEVSERTITQIEYAINNMPRKILNYKTAYEVFQKQISKNSSPQN